MNIYAEERTNPRSGGPVRRNDSDAQWGEPDLDVKSRKWGGKNQGVSSSLAATHSAARSPANTFCGSIQVGNITGVAHDVLYIRRRKVTHYFIICAHKKKKKQIIHLKFFLGLPVNPLSMDKVCSKNQSEFCVSDLSAAHEP